MLQICQNIKEIRKSKQLSQETVAERMGLKRDTYKNWEIDTEPDLATIKTIAAAIGVPAYTLLKDIIDYSNAAETRPDVKYTITLPADHVDKLKFSLNVLGSIFSPVSDLGKLEYPMVEDISDNKTSRSLKSQKGKQKDIS